MNSMENWIPQILWKFMYQVSQQVLDYLEGEKIRKSLFTFDLAVQISLQFDDFFGQILIF